jgi:hypothetical protein
MEAYKLVRHRSDGTLSPLFINRKQVLPLGTWLEAEDHPTKGFAHRPGWHASVLPYAPHLKMALANGERRVWVRLLVEDYVLHQRPRAQGGMWLIANRMLIQEILNDARPINRPLDLISGRCLDPAKARWASGRSADADPGPPEQDRP